MRVCQLVNPRRLILGQSDAGMLLGAYTLALCSISHRLDCLFVGLLVATNKGQYGHHSQYGYKR